MSDDTEHKPMSFRQVVAELADALPVDEEAERELDRALANARAKEGPPRKMVAASKLDEAHAERNALKAEVERLTAERDAAARNALAETIVSVKHEREANDAIALVVGERDAARAEVERLSRENSAHRALAMLEPKEMSYADRAEFERLKRADVEQGKRIAALTLSPSECEALQWARDAIAMRGGTEPPDPGSPLAVIDKILVANGGE